MFTWADNLENGLDLQLRKGQLTHLSNYAILRSYEKIDRIKSVREKQADSDPVTKPYKVVNIQIQFITLQVYDIITASLSANFSRAMYNHVFIVI